MADTLRSRCQSRLEALKSLRDDYDDEAYDIARFMATSRSRFLHKKGTTARGEGKTDRNERRIWNSKLANTHGIEAMRVLAHGMTSGLTSASRPWFTLAAQDAELMDRGEVRDWLSEVEKRMYRFIAGTNFYGAAKSGYAEMGLFGTEACIATEHREHGMVCHNLTFGEYWIACGDARVPDVLYRRCPLTVREAVQMFGNSVSERVMRLYDQSNYTDIVDMYQAIEPEADCAGEFGQFPWRSVYWDNDDQRESVTKISGFMEQAFWAPRWDVASGETWGSSPGMDALPTVRELLMATKRGNEMIDQITKPEKIVPPGVRLTGQPGRVVSASGITKENVVVPYVPEHHALSRVYEKEERLERKIDALTYAELFNAITNMQGIQPRTVEEIAARNEEKLTQLGPVIERVSNEKLEVVIDRVFGIMSRGGLLPPVPEVMSGQPLKVEFVSILTVMQRMVGIGQIERTSGFIGNLAGLKPEAADKLDVDALIDEYAERTGAPPKIIRSADEVKKDRDERAQQQQMAMAAEMAPAARDGAEAARLLSEAGDGVQLPSAIPV